MKKLMALVLAGTMILTPILVNAEETDVAALEERVEALEKQVSDQLELIGVMYEIGKRKGLWGEIQDEMALINAPAETEAAAAPSDFYFEDGGCSLQYVSSELAKDYRGNDVLVVYFDYVNNSGKDKAAYLEFRVQAFQNGKENNGIPIIYPDIPEHEDSMAQIMSGAGPIRVAFIEPLSDMSDVTLRVSPLISFGDEHLDIPIRLQ